MHTTKNDLRSPVVRRFGLLVGLALALVLAAGSVRAQNEASEAKGRVLDKEGNPVQGAVVTFSPKSSPHLKYTAKTNKKGRFFVAGLYTPQEDDVWQMQVEAESMLPIEVQIESRTVNRVLIGDKMTVPLKAGSQLPEFPIPKMGTATVDFKLAPASEVEQPAMAAEPVETDSGDSDGKAAAAPVPQKKKDPWAVATSLAGQGNLAGSLEYFREAIDDEPEEIERRETYAKVLAEMGRYDEASAALGEAIAAEPDSSGLYKVQGMIQVKTDDLQGALDSFAKAAELAPEDVSIQRQLAYVAGQLGDLDGQIAAYNAIAQVNPDDAEAWMALGNVYHKAGKPKESEAAYQKVVEIDPKNAYQTYFNLGSLIMNRRDRNDEDTQRAIQAFRRATEIKKNYAPAYKQLAFALLGVGDRGGAKKAFQDFLEVNPKGPEADQVRALLGSL